MAAMVIEFVKTWALWHHQRREDVPFPMKVFWRVKVTRTFHLLHRCPHVLTQKASQLWADSDRKHRRDDAAKHIVPCRRFA